MEMSQSNRELRQAYKKLRDEMPLDLREYKSHDICENVLALLESDFKGANIFLCFYPFGSEVNLLPLYNRLLENGKKLYFPISNIEGHKLIFHRIEGLHDDFHKGYCGIMEPNDDLTVFEQSEEQVISITPGLIFDKKLNRIGYGAGYYDRFFADKPDIIKLAPIFSEQLVETINACSHDVPMDYIVTENDVLKGDRL